MTQTTAARTAPRADNKGCPWVIVVEVQCEFDETAGRTWTKRYPWIVEAALKNREQQFAIDGEAVVLGVDGASDFNALHSRKHDHEVQLYAFDILALGGEDLRQLPLRQDQSGAAAARPA